MSGNPFRELPSISELSDALGVGGSSLSPPTRVDFAQAFLESIRDEIAKGATISRDEIIARAAARVRQIERSRLRPLINATGVVVHTNLGRAPVSAATAEAMRQAASGYVPLEIDPETNTRGGRMTEIADLMRLLTGAESTLVVNNNAAAVLLVLSAIAAGKSVIVSRGEAVEIGGGFRVPDVMRQSGARLIEVGTTNRTYLRDYEAAVELDTAVFLKVHSSNFTIEGFVASTGLAELASLSRRTGISVIEDLGSGALLDTVQFGLAAEPTISECFRSGADVITASGDKLLGGPQAGIIAGRADLVEKIGRHPLARAVRADKTTLAGIAATLRHYTGGTAVEEIPVWRMISEEIAVLSSRARSLADRLSAFDDWIGIVESEATIGGGSLPGQSLPSVALTISAPNESVDDLAKRLRLGDPRVFGRIERDRLFLDLRTVLAEQDSDLAEALCQVFSA